MSAPEQYELKDLGTSREEIVGKVHAALEAANGDRRKAAVLLNVSVTVLHAVIRSSEDLQTRWKGTVSPLMANQVKAPNESELLVTRPKKPKIPPEQRVASDREVVRLQERVREDLRRAFSALQLKETEIQLAMAQQSFFQKFMLRAADMIGGSMVTIVPQMHSLWNSTSTRLEIVRQQMSQTNDPDALAFLFHQERHLMDSLISIAGKLKEIFDVADRGVLSRAALQLKMRQQKSPEKPVNPGWLPIPGVLPRNPEADES